ncbi:TPA: hypothetical protein IRP92_005251 [Escherichia coli]|nr:hypothetical protein [Escherichia coli]
MKHPLLELIKLMFIFAITCSIGMVASTWLIIKEDIPFSEYILAGKIGTIVGMWGGAGIWFLYWLNSRKSNK